VSGYGQSKAVAEHLVRQARSRGLPVVIYRPCLISGSTSTGASATHDFTALLLKGLLASGAFPAWMRQVPTLRLTPVDYVSRAVVHLSALPDVEGQTFHLANLVTQSGSEFIETVRAAGFPMRELPDGEWFAKLRDLARQLEDRDFERLVPLLSGDSALRRRSLDPYRIDTASTRARLADTTITCPVVDGELINKYVAYFSRIGFVRSPLAGTAVNGVAPVPPGVEARFVTVIPAEGRPLRRLLCFPHAGGDPGFFRQWKPALASPGTEVLALALERSGDGTPQPLDIAATLTAVRSAIGPVIDLPYAVFGHSMGALLAWETVCRLRDEGARLPVHLFLSSLSAPHTFEVMRKNMMPKVVGAYLSSGIGQAVREDTQMVLSWKYAARPPLDLPLTVFHGRKDLAMSQEAVEAWSGYTTGTFAVRVAPGGHFHIADRDSPVTGAIRAVQDGLAATPPARANLREVRGDREGWLARLRERLNLRPAAMTGSWHSYELAHIARVSDAGAPDRPLFPEALDRLAAAEAEGDRGPLFRSTHPLFRQIIALSTANTLLRWNGRSGRFAPQVRRLLERAVSEREKFLEPAFAGGETPYGKGYKVIGFFGQTVLPGGESRQILDRAPDLDEPIRAVLEANARPHARAAAMPLSPGRIKALLQGVYGSALEAGVLTFGEHFFPDEVLLSQAARENARRNPGMPLWNVELCARYLELTRDPIAETALSNLMPRLDDGLRPHGRLHEVVFALHYLVRAGIDVARHLPEAVHWFLAALRTEGVGVTADDPFVDTDTTAVALYVTQALGVNKIARGAAVFDSRWSEESQNYRHFTGLDAPETFTTMAILETYLRDPAVSRERQRAVWGRTLGLLEQRVWIQGGFVSPFILWEKIISVLFAYEHRFPERTTKAHHRALDLVLSLQEPGGGFRSFYYDEANPEETAYALYALKAALGAPLPPVRRDQVRGAALAAERFLEECWRNTPPGYQYPDQWIGKLTCSPVNAIEAIILGALLMPWPEPASAATALSRRGSPQPEPLSTPQPV
jgi:surfactin synthase thioesterase subunit